MAAEANARCAALEITLAEERAKVARLLAEVRFLLQALGRPRPSFVHLTPRGGPPFNVPSARLAIQEKEKAREAAARHQPASFQSPPALVKTVPESPAMSEISTPVLEMGVRAAAESLSRPGLWSGTPLVCRRFLR